MLDNIILSLGIITGFFIAGIIPYCFCSFAIQMARRWRAVSSILRAIDTARDEIDTIPLDGSKLRKEYDATWDVISDIENIAIGGSR